MEIVPLPVIMETGKKSVAAWCPILDIATQGKDEREARKNMEELITWYFEDEDTTKPSFESVSEMSISITNVPVSISSHSVCKNEASCPICP